MRKMSAIATIILFVLVLIPSTVSAVEFRWDAPSLERFVRYLQNIVTPSWTVQKDGQCMDPDGVPVTCSAGNQAGAEIDPEGAVGTGNEAGASIDPLGSSGS